MRGVTIIKDDKPIHTGNDLDLVQTTKEINQPDIQSYLVEVPGRNGLLNLTKGLTGNITYKNRTIKLEYLATGKREDQLKKLDLFNTWHGDVITVIDDDTPDDYYIGEASVSHKWDGVLLTITLSINAEPFRKSLQPTVIAFTLNTTPREVVLYNGGITLTPTVEVSGDAKITQNNTTYNLSTGTYSALELKTGQNLITLSGTGSVSISFEEARI